MRFKNLDLNLLVALDTLIRVRNVSRAAEEMFITQSAMSNALARLREYFNDPILIQVGRSMKLSPLAASIELPLRDIIVRIEATVVSTPTFVPENESRSFSFIVSDYTVLTIMPGFLQRLATRAPGIQIHFKPQQNYPHLLLERGEADFLIAPTVFCSTNHPTELLLEEQLCCIVDAQGPFGDGPISQADFLAAGHIVMQPPNGGESFAQRAFDQAGIKLRIEATTYFFASLPLLVRGSQRIALVQRSLADVLNVSGTRLVEPPFALPTMHQSLQWHSYRTRDPALTWIREQLLESIKLGQADQTAIFQPNS